MNYFPSKTSFTVIGALWLVTSVFSSCYYKAKSNSDKLALSECRNCLQEIVIHSSFPFAVNKGKVKVRIDEESSDFVKLKLYDDSRGDSTLGWVIYRPKERKLANISSYLDSLPLEIDRRWLIKYETCKGIVVKREVKQRFALNHMN